MNSLKISEEAYTLWHSPTRLLEWLFSKYGDIEEDYYTSQIDLLLYNKPSRYLTIYQEFQWDDPTEEFLKRFYTKSESRNRLPNLSDYYKNYHLFFCWPSFCNFKFTNLLHKYCEYKAEWFYKHNYADNSSKKSEINKSSESSLLSLDNITNNGTIFDMSTRKQINNVINGYQMVNKSNITMTLNNTSVTSSYWYSKRSKDNSFINWMNGFKPKKKSSCVTHNNNNNNINTNKQKKNASNNKMKSSWCTLTKTKKVSDKNNFSRAKYILSPRWKPFWSSYQSNFSEFTTNNPKMFSSMSGNLINSTNKSKTSNFSIQFFGKNLIVNTNSNKNIFSNLNTLGKARISTKPKTKSSTNVVTTRPLSNNTYEYRNSQININKDIKINNRTSSKTGWKPIKATIISDQQIKGWKPNNINSLSYTNVIMSLRNMNRSSTFKSVIPSQRSTSKKEGQIKGNKQSNLKSEMKRIQTNDNLIISRNKNNSTTSVITDSNRLNKTKFPSNSGRKATKSVEHNTRNENDQRRAIEIKKKNNDNIAPRKWSSQIEELIRKSKQINGHFKSKDNWKSSANIGENVDRVKKRNNVYWNSGDSWKNMKSVDSVNVNYDCNCNWDLKKIIHVNLNVNLHMKSYDKQIKVLSPKGNKVKK